MDKLNIEKIDIFTYKSLNKNLKKQENDKTFTYESMVKKEDISHPFKVGYTKTGVLTEKKG